MTVEVAAEPAAALAHILRGGHHPLPAAPPLLHLPLLERGEGVYSHIGCSLEALLSGNIRISLDMLTFKN
jgi:hypothetical protein